MKEQVDTILDQLGPVFSNRSWIVAPGITSPERFLAPLLRLSPEKVLLVHMGLDDIDKFQVQRNYKISTEAPTLLGALKNYEDILADPPPDLASQVALFDPHGTANVLLSPLISLEHVLGRKTFGARPRDWRGLEDKITFYRFLRKNHIAVPKHMISPLTLESLSRCYELLDAGSGVVIAPETGDILTGGGTHLWWIKSSRELTDVVHLMGPTSRMARVMPFHEGTTCSVHGWVHEGEVYCFPPVELFVHYSEAHPRLLYAGYSTYWKPTCNVTTDLKEVATKIGKALYQQYDYRGFFNVDAVSTNQGIVVTETNTRIGGTLWILFENQSSQLPLALMDAAIRHRVPLTLSPAKICAQIEAHTYEHPAFHIQWFMPHFRARDVNGNVVKAEGSYQISTQKKPDSIEYYTKPVFGGTLVCANTSNRSFDGASLSDDAKTIASLITRSILSTK